MIYDAMAPVPVFLLGFYSSILALTTNGVSAQLLPVTTDKLLSHLENGFSEGRSYAQPAQKENTRKYIKDFLQNLASNYSTTVLEHTYTFDDTNGEPSSTCVSTSCSGVNFVWVLPGSRYGTPEDKVHLLGAHYDSQTNTPGVDDNGSGMATMLETARILSQSELDCEQLNSLVFVAFDWEELGTFYGSRLFLEQISNLTERGLPQITEDTFAGAVILDTIMNWNNSENSQMFPDGFEQALPGAYAKLQKNGFKGNSLNIIQREDDREIGEGLAAVWGDLADAKYDSLELQLPQLASGRPSTWAPQINYAFGDFLRSDHAHFWNFPTPDNKGLKAVFLTDSANFRGVMKDCYHNPCDNLDNVTPEKLEFIAKTTEMLVRYYLQKTTENNATECGGEPQENWNSDPSNTTPDPPNTTPDPPNTTPDSPNTTPDQDTTLEPSNTVLPPTKPDTNGTPGPHVEHRMLTLTAAIFGFLLVMLK